MDLASATSLTQSLELTFFHSDVIKGFSQLRTAIWRSGKESCCKILIYIFSKHVSKSR